MKLGIIGGSGLYHLPELEIRERREVMTPFGPPSDALVIGSLAGSELIFLPRHGAGHTHNPSELPYRANMYALKEAGVTHLLSVNAVGSLQPHLPPLTLVIPDQVIDRTVSRERTFFEEGIVAHVGIADPFCPELSEGIAVAAKSSGHPAVSGGTYICIEGPQFSTKAESRLYRSWDASVIGMTVMPEARLAREAELCYASLSRVTDFDVWHEEEEPVTVEIVQERLRANTAAAQAIITTLAKTGLPERSRGCKNALDSAIITDPARITSDQRTRLAAILGNRLGAVE